MNPTNLKVLHIIDSGGLYGAEMVLLNLVEEQKEMGLEPAIVSIGEKHIREKPLEKEALKRGFNVKKFRMRPGPNIAGAWKILRFAHQEGFNLMHSHGYKGNILFGFLPKKIRKIPLVATLHGWTSTNSFTRMKLYEWLDLLSLKYIDAVILVSQAMKSHPRLKNLSSVNFHVIPNGIPISDGESSNFAGTTNTTNSIYPMKFRSMTAKRISSGQTFTPLNSKTIQPGQSTQATQGTQKFDPSIVDFCKKGYTIGSIGRLSKEKGYSYLIEAFNLLIKEGFDLRLIIIGEGFERNSLQALATQFELSDRIMLPGYRDDAKNYLPYLNLFVISSLTEGLPITLLEAMQAKVPIVASAVGGIPDVLDNGNAGLLFEPCKQYDLYEAIIKIHQDSDLVERLVNNAYQRLTTQYSSKIMALKYLKVYEQFI